MKNRFRIASPCSADWSRMVGDERVRYCPECKLNVYNFSEMTEVEVEEAVARREGRLCARFYQRPDGTLLTQNCPVGFRGAIWRASGIASAALAAAMSVSPAMAGTTQEKKNLQLMQIQPVETGLALQVVDPAGAVVPKAHVKLTNEETREEVLGETDESGQLRLSDLPRGSYEVRVSILGFRTLTVVGLTVPSREKLKLELGMPVIMGEVVLVTGLDQESIPISNVLVEPPSASSGHPGVPAQRKNVFRRFLSGLRRVF